MRRPWRYFLVVMVAVVCFWLCCVVLCSVEGSSCGCVLVESEEGLKKGFQEAKQGETQWKNG